MAIDGFKHVSVEQTIFKLAYEISREYTARGELVGEIAKLCCLVYHIHPMAGV